MRLNNSPRFLLPVLAAVAVMGAVALSARPSAGREAPQGGTVIQIRDFEKASIVEIVAWSAMEPRFGLRTWVRRNGAPDRYHRLWVNADYPAIRDAPDAKGLNRPLQVSSATDNQNCLSGKCSPNSTVGARLPDEALRKEKGDVAVKFITTSGAEIVFTARRPLLDAYLASVDSVIGALKK